MRDLKIARENLARAMRKQQELEALLKKHQDGKVELQNEVNELKNTLE